MDITLSKAQQDMAKEARRFLKNECPIDFISEMFDDKKGYTDKFWSKIIELDWPAMCIPEKYSGMGMELIDMVMVLEESGRFMMPGPFFSTVMYAAETLLAAGTEAQKEKYLPQIVDGKIKGTLAVFEPDSGADPTYIQMEAKAQGKDFVLNGSKVLVSDAHESNFIICAARTSPGNDPSNGITLFMVDPKKNGVTVSLLPTMDSTRKYCAVEFKNVAVSAGDILGEVDKGWAPLNRAMDRAIAASAAKAYIPPMFYNVTCGTVQVLGGTGFVWENEIHYYLKRAKANEVVLGDQDYHHERLLKLLSL